jgi:hypothetical protein
MIVPESKASINYFSTSAVFDSMFLSLIKMQDILPFKRNYDMKVYQEDVIEVKWLLDEYTDYALAMFPTSEDKERKKEILERLGEIDAKRLGSQITQLNPR